MMTYLKEKKHPEATGINDSENQDSDLKKII